MFGKIRHKTVLNIVHHGIFLLILYIIQAEIIPWMGIGVVPMLIVVAAAGLSHFTDSGRGAVLGLACGVLCDIAFGKATIVYTVTLSIIGLVLGYLGETVLSRGLPSYILSCFGALLVTTFIQMFELLFFDHISLLRLFLTAAVQIVVSLICAVLLYPVIRKLSQRYR